LLYFSAEEAVQYQLDALKYNDQPHQDYGIEVMYRVGPCSGHTGNCNVYIHMNK